MSGLPRRDDQLALKYDIEANSMYISLGEGKKKVFETIQLGKDRFVDVDETGTMIGLEIIFPKKVTREMEEVLERSQIFFK